MNEYGMNEFELIKKADVMRIINSENAIILNNMKERSTDEVLCAIASQINALQTMAKSGNRLIDADAFSEQCGNYYAEEGPADGFIGTVGDLIAKQPTIKAEPVRHGHWIPTEYDSYADGVPVCDKWECSECGHEHSGEEDTLTAFCPDCGARMDGCVENDDSV